MQRPLLFLAHFAVRLYYRAERLGARVPDGPVLLVANHPNGLVDPVLLAGVAERPVRFLGKAPLFDLPVLGALVRGMRTLPIYRPMDGASTAQNAATFSAVHQALAEGDVVCLFPEGTSHSDPSVRELRTGAARMALGAEDEQDFCLGVKIVPVGLIYPSKRRFRSQVATWVGEPIEVRKPPERREQGARTSAADDREAVRALTERIERGLRAVSLELERWDDLALVSLADRLLAEDARDEPRWPRVRTIAQHLRTLRRHAPQRTARLAERAERFQSRLRRLGLEIGDVGLRYPPRRVASFVLRHLSLLLVGLPLALAGTCVWWLPYRLVPVVTRRVGPSQDIFATVQILAGAVVFLAWLSALFTLGWRLGGVAWAAAGTLGMIALGPLTLRFWDHWAQVTRDVAAFFRLSFAGGLRRELEAEKAGLAAEIRALAPLLAGTAGPREGPRRG